jgi:hypothetical protein
MTYDIQNFKVSDLNYYWSRIPGKFVSKTSGKHHVNIKFTGADREWCETLVESIIDVSNHIEDSERVNVCIAHPDVHVILKNSVLYKPVANSNDGLLLNRYVIHEDENVPKDKILVGCDIGFGNILTDPGSYGFVTILDVL